MMVKKIVVWLFGTGQGKVKFFIKICSQILNYINTIANE